MKRRGAEQRHSIHVDPQTDYYNTQRQRHRLDCVTTMLDSTARVRNSEHTQRLTNQAKRERWQEMSKEIAITVQSFRDKAKRSKEQVPAQQVPAKQLEKY